MPSNSLHAVGHRAVSASERCCYPLSDAEELLHVEGDRKVVLALGLFAERVCAHGWCVSLYSS